MLTQLSSTDAGIVISALVSALVAVVLFAVWLIKKTLDDKDKQIAALQIQVAGIGQVATNAERLGTTMEQLLGIVREMRILLDIAYRPHLAGGSGGHNDEGETQKAGTVV